MDLTVLVGVGGLLVVAVIIYLKIRANKGQQQSQGMTKEGLLCYLELKEPVHGDRFNRIEIQDSFYRKCDLIFEKNDELLDKLSNFDDATSDIRNISDVELDSPLADQITHLRNVYMRLLESGNGPADPRLRTEITNLVSVANDWLRAWDFFESVPHTSFFMYKNAA